MASKMKCPKCQKKISDNQKKAVCINCSYCFHLSCCGTNLRKSDCFTCNFCQDSKCGKCSMPVFNHHNALCCDNSFCNKWFHLKCTNVSFYDYCKLGQSSSPWFCKNCFVFPFSHLETSLFVDINPPILPTESIPYCSSCHKTVQKHHARKAIPCSFCRCLIHRKCAKMVCPDYSLLKHFTCVDCASTNFPFYNVTKDDIMKSSFNSNFDCPCATQTDFKFDKSVLPKFDISLVNDKFEFNDIIENSTSMLVNFDYFDFHDL